MASATRAQLCLFWARRVHDGVHVLNDPWNGNASADPASLSGGIPFGATGIPGTPLYLSSLGTGDSKLAANTGATPFTKPVPQGYFPGWPDAGGGPDLFDPSTAQGSALVIGGGLETSFPTVAGMVRSKTGWATGKFYLEYTVAQNTLFTNFSGMGFAPAGVDLNFWSNAGFNVSNPNGGIRLTGGLPNDFFTSVVVNSALTLPGFTTDTQGSIMALALALVPLALFIPSDFSAVNLPCIPCCSFGGAAG